MFTKSLPLTTCRWKLFCRLTFKMLSADDSESGILIFMHSVLGLPFTENWEIHQSISLSIFRIMRIIKKNLRRVPVRVPRPRPRLSLLHITFLCDLVTEMLRWLVCLGLGLWYLVINEIRLNEDFRRVQKTVPQLQQGQWTNWDNALQKSLTFNDIWHMAPLQISFLIRPVYDLLPYNANLAW